MSDIYEVMSILRAVRRLKPDPVPHDVLQRVLQAAAWAPTGGNVQPFRIVAVTASEQKQAIQKLYDEEWAKYTTWHRKAIPGMEEPQKSATEKMVRAGDYLAANMHTTPVILVFCFNPDNMAITDSDLGRPSVVGGGSVYTAVQNVMLACVEEGLGCVLTTLLCYREAEVKAILNIPDNWYTCAHVPIGYPVLKGHGPINRRPVDKLVYANSWGEAWS
ncbi:MAG: nitroreductase family protein [Pseudomonadales bacterium]|nr:nitroreductase family protein [Pseudomonadales bacterium]